MISHKCYSNPHVLIMRSKSSKDSSRGFQVSSEISFLISVRKTLPTSGQTVNVTSKIFQFMIKLLPILEYNVPWFIVLLWFNFRSPILCHVIEGNNLLSNFSTAINKLQLRKQVAPYSEAALLCQNHLHIWCRAVILSLHYSVLCTATLSAISLRCINNHYMETNVCFKALPLLALFGWLWLVLIYRERKILLAGWWPSVREKSIAASCQQNRANSYMDHRISRKPTQCW